MNNKDLKTKKTAVRKETPNRAREKQRQLIRTLMRGCWQPISNLSSCCCKILLVVL